MEGDGQPLPSTLGTGITKFEPVFDASFQFLINFLFINDKNFLKENKYYKTNGGGAIYIKLKRGASCPIQKPQNKRLMGPIIRSSCIYFIVFYNKCVVLKI